MGLKPVGLKAVGRKKDEGLAERVARLEQEVADLRRHNLRLAELADLVQELLVPMAQRDQERVDAAIAAFQDSL